VCVIWVTCVAVRWRARWNVVVFPVLAQRVGLIAIRMPRSWWLVPDVPTEPAGEDLPALVAALRAANARLREVIEAKDAQLAAAGAALRRRRRSSPG
jgi:hypothetical protein